MTVSGAEAGSVVALFKTHLSEVSYPGCLSCHHNVLVHDACYGGAPCFTGEGFTLGGGTTGIMTVIGGFGKCKWPSFRWLQSQTRSI